MRFGIAQAILLLISLMLCASNINCYESYEMDLFDLVEEVNQNFYEFFGVTQVNFIFLINIQFLN